MTDCALAPKAKETISASSTVMRFIRVGMVWAALPFAVLVVRIVFFFCCMFFVFWGFGESLESLGALGTLGTLGGLGDYDFSLFLLCSDLILYILSVNPPC